MSKKKTSEIKAPKKVAKEAPVKAPKKKKHTGLKVFAILMTIFVVFPIAFVFIAFFDPSTKKVSNKETHYENLVAETFYNSVRELASTGTLGFTINEEMIDGVMALGCDKINQKQFIPKMYCNINGNHYDFIVDLQASFFKTRVHLKTSLTNDNETVLTFKINQIVVGRLPIPVNWITGIMGNFIKDETINNAFTQAGFNIKCHLAKAKLIYAKEDFRVDVRKYVEKLANNNEYLKLIFDVIGACTGDNDLISATYEDGITASIALSALRLPEAEPYNPPLNFPIEKLDKHRENVITWLNNGWLEEKDVANMFSYLIRGYELSNETIQKYVDDISGDFLSALKEVTGDPNIYPGTICNENNQDFYTYCTTGVGEKEINITPEIPESLGNPFKITLDGDSLNQYLARKMTDAIGKTIPITYKDAENKWQFEYIFVDNLFTKFDGGNNPQMNLYLSLNISGYPVCLKLATDDIQVEGASKDGTGTFGSITFDIKNICFGTIPLSDTSLLDTIIAMIPSDSEFSFRSKDEEKGHNIGYFSIGLDKYIDISKEEIKNKVIEYLSDKNKYSTSVEDNNFILSASIQS